MSLAFTKTWLSAAAGLTGSFTARLSVGHLGDPSQSRAWVAGAEQPARWHKGVRLTPGCGVRRAAGRLEEVLGRQTPHQQHLSEQTVVARPLGTLASAKRRSHSRA